MDRLDGMQAFIRVAETGSFTKAADILGMSRATVTQLIQQLEARLQTKLLNRTTRRVNVTTDGAAYYERLVRLLTDLDDIEGSLPSRSTAPRGRLRVDVPSPLANVILVPALPAFHERFPDIQIEMGASDRKVNLIDENVDCVVRGGEMQDGWLVARHVGDLKLGVYAAPAYLSRAGIPMHPDQLREPGHHIVRYGWDSNLSYAMRRGSEVVNLGGRHILAIDDGNAYLTAGLAGMGVLWLPEYMAKPHIAGGALTPLFEDWQMDAIPLHLAYPPNRYIGKPLRVFIDWIVELMSVHGPRTDRHRKTRPAD
ncbi:LysR family transcriptional regulator [Cupriavidus pauculus]|uniref:LysR family transcriptional regulator n=1 Tax=Cupriavidus pauculus TaxID=82633 RepID=A0A2N5C5N5_9BURK|nr:LysR family transcriptional regulator [Cupriavidus pauculus]PLP97536.1 LysR family transcriptional regulator [Cupriavidus pauculus]